VQIKDWLDRGGAASEIETLIARMQTHFVRAFVRDAQRSTKGGKRAGSRV
jgi:hypothetical protein